MSGGCGYHLSAIGKAPTSGKGLIGEVISSDITAASSLAIASGRWTQLTSITLDPGKWLIAGDVAFISAGISAADYLGCGAGAPSGANRQQGCFNRYNPALNITTVAATNPVLLIKTRPLVISATTTIIIEAIAGYTGFPLRIYGSIVAMRLADA